MISSIPQRDLEILQSVQARVGVGKQGDMMHLFDGFHCLTRDRCVGEAHWRYRFEAVEEGGIFWPGLPDTLEEFLELMRYHSCSVFYEETLPACGVQVDPDRLPLEEHHLSVFGIDLPLWSICPLDAELYRAKRSHPGYLERWFAGFPSPHPSASSLGAMTQAICTFHHLPYPGPMSLAPSPIHPRPPGKTGSYAVLHAAQIEAARARADQRSPDHRQDPC